MEGSFQQLLTEATPVGSLLPKSCYAVQSYSASKVEVSFLILCVVPRSHDNDPRGSATNEALLGVQWNYKRG